MQSNFQKSESVFSSTVWIYGSTMFYSRGQLIYATLVELNSCDRLYDKTSNIFCLVLCQKKEKSLPSPDLPYCIMLILISSFCAKCFWEWGKNVNEKIITFQSLPLLSCVGVLMKETSKADSLHLSVCLLFHWVCCWRLWYTLAWRLIESKAGNRHEGRSQRRTQPPPEGEDSASPFPPSCHWWSPPLVRLHIHPYADLRIWLVFQGPET